MECHCFKIAYDNFVVCSGVSTKSTVLMTCIKCGKTVNLTEHRSERTLADIIAIADKHCLESHSSTNPQGE
jgi:hypothetical protein